MHQKVNNILFLLHSFEVVDLVQEHYAKYGNPSPPLVLAKAIEELEEAYNAVSDRQRIVEALRAKAQTHLNRAVMMQLADDIEKGVL